MLEAWGHWGGRSGGLSSYLLSCGRYSIRALAGQPQKATFHTEAGGGRTSAVDVPCMLSLTVFSAHVLSNSWRSGTTWWILGAKSTGLSLCGCCVQAEAGSGGIYAEIARIFNVYLFQ